MSDQAAAPAAMKITFDEPVLQKKTVNANGRDYVLTELNGLQRVKFEALNFSKQFEEMSQGEQVEFWYNYRSSLIAFSLEESAGVGYEELIPQIQKQRPEFIEILYEPAARLSGYWVEPDKEGETLPGK